jgi:hypothetical protein
VCAEEDPLKPYESVHFILKATLQTETPAARELAKSGQKTRRRAGAKVASLLVERGCEVISTVDFRFREIQGRVGMLTPTPIVRAQKERPGTRQHDQDMTELVVDNTLEDSFPASDPPSWTASVARLTAAGTT